MVTRGAPPTPELRLSGEPPLQVDLDFVGLTTAREAARPPEGRDLRSVLECSPFLEGETLASRRPEGSLFQESYPSGGTPDSIGVKLDKERD